MSLSHVVMVGFWFALYLSAAILEAEIHRSSRGPDVGLGNDMVDLERIVIAAVTQASLDQLIAADRGLVVQILLAAFLELVRWSVGGRESSLAMVPIAAVGTATLSGVLNPASSFHDAILIAMMVDLMRSAAVTWRSQ